MKLEEIRIKEEPNKFHENILNLWGNAFNFSHEKGLAEWLKNSVDAYYRMGVPDERQYIIFRFTNGTEKTPPIIECIDYAGMSHADIQKAFKWWGDPNAAKRGLRVRVYGGHGNGGKFYMRQMFKRSFFVTYRDGKLNIFGFNDNKKYGFARGFEDKKVTLRKAFEIAGLSESFIPKKVLDELKKGKTGFTVVKGIRPKKIVGRKLPVFRISERFKYHPQARRPLKYCHVSIVHNEKLVIDWLRMEEIESLSGFEKPAIFEIPDFLEVPEKRGRESKVKMRSNKYGRGKLVLKTSSIPFGHSGKKAELNCIDVVGEIGVIASYRMHEIGFLRFFPQAQYIYGECSCPILEDPENDCVQNDREKLVENDRTKALRAWIAGRIDEVTDKIAEKETKEEKKKDIEKTDEFNQILNKWKNQFMNRLFAEVLGGLGEGKSTGGFGDEGSGGGGKDKSEEKGGKGSGMGKGGGEGEQKKRGSKMPLVLLSGQEDPDYPGVPVKFSDRHSLVEQRPQDVKRGIYWINLKKPLAEKTIEMYGRESTQWRNYLFQRYVDIFIKETIYRLARREGGSMTPEQVDTEITRVASLVNDKASSDLEEFLLRDKYTAEKKDDKKKKK